MKHSNSWSNKGLWRSIIPGQNIAAEILQSSVLGQIIFGCSINNLPSITRSEKVFTDNCTLVNSIHHSLNDTSMPVFMKTWTTFRSGLISKKCLLLISNERVPDHLTSIFNGNTINELHSINNHGIIDQKLNWIN